MKLKRKGKKVHPSPPQPATTPTTTLSTTAHDSLSVLELLPSAILTVIVALTVQDREVLAYMITRSLKTTTTGSINSSMPLKCSGFHKSPVFNCECFECYTSFWFRWDSSPNREVIHQAIEAFEEHLASDELVRKRTTTGNRRGKKKEKASAVENETMKLPVDVTLPEMVAERQIEVAEEAAATTGFARKVFPDVFGVLNSRLWNLWGPNV